MKDYCLNTEGEAYLV